MLEVYGNQYFFATDFYPLLKVYALYTLENIDIFGQPLNMQNNYVPFLKLIVQRSLLCEVQTDALVTLVWENNFYQH